MVKRCLLCGQEANLNENEICEDCAASLEGAYTDTVECAKCGATNAISNTICVCCASLLPRNGDSFQGNLQNQSPQGGTETTLCRVCGSRNPTTNRFCDVCGSPINSAKNAGDPCVYNEPSTITCTCCGAINPSCNTYCLSCGTPLKVENAYTDTSPEQDEDDTILEQEEEPDNQHWWYMQGENKVGPYPKAGIEAEIDSGYITGDTYLFTDTFTQWTKAKNTEFALYPKLKPSPKNLLDEDINSKSHRAKMVEIESTIFSGEQAVVEDLGEFAENKPEHGSSIAGNYVDNCDQKVNPSNKIELWNPAGLVVISILSSFLPASILYSLNYGRMGMFKKKILSLLVSPVLFALMIAILIIVDQPILKEGCCVVNVAAGIYMCYKQSDLFEKHISEGGKKASFRIPVILCIIFAAAYYVFLFLV